VTSLRSFVAFTHFSKIAIAVSSWPTVGAAQRVGECWMLVYGAVVDLKCLLEVRNRLARLTPSERELPKADKRGCTVVVRRRFGEDAFVEPTCLAEIVEAKGNVGLNQNARRILALGAPATRRQVLLAHAEPPGELAQNLKRGTAVSGFQTRDVGSGAAWERQRALAESRSVTGRP